jgi:hypothetical protein
VEPREPWCNQTQWGPLPGVNEIDAVDDAVVNYYRVRVHNKGRTRANACHVNIREIWFAERGVWKRLDGWEPVDAIWSGRKHQPTVSLSQDEQAFCDIGHVVSNYIQSNLIRPTQMRVIRRDVRRPQRPGRFLLDLQTEYVSQPNALEQGHYALGIRLYSENAPTVAVALDLRVSGRFASALDTFQRDAPPLAGVVLQQRRRLPKEGIVDDEPVPEDEDDRPA